MLPPPISTSKATYFCRSIALETARWIKRASSSPLMTSTGMPVACRMRFHQNFLVGGLAHGTGGYRPELADAVIVHHLLEGGEGIDRFLHAGFADDAGAIFEGILAQPDGHAQAFEGFQVECVIHLAINRRIAFEPTSIAAMVCMTLTGPGFGFHPSLRREKMDACIFILCHKS